MYLKSGMTVKVIRGNHKGKEGKILRILKDRNRVIVEGVNLIKKHTKPGKPAPDPTSHILRIALVLFL